jgi:Tfp pilus assembly protein PilV
VIRTPARSPSNAEQGFVLIEILVSALVLAIAAGGVVTLLNATGRAGAEDRRRSEAYAVAQEDQARLRSMQLSSLNRLNENRTVTLNGSTFTVNSTGVFVNDSTGSTTCTQGSASADYVVVGTKVTWPGLGGRPAPTIKSILSPANGSLDPSHGTLSVTVKNAAGAAIPGIGLSGNGPSTFTGTTDSTGCAMFPDIPAGTYTITPTGIAAGLVDQDGKAAGPFTVGVVGSSTNSAPRLYDVPGKLKEVTFKTRKADGTIIDSAADSIVVFNTGMTTGKTFGTPGAPTPGTPIETRKNPFEMSTNLLFPFASPATVYAGSCGTNNPNPTGEASPPGAAAMASVQITPSGLAAGVTLQLPALYIKAWTGKNSSSPGSAFNGADVWIRDEKCASGSTSVTREYSTDSTGGLANPGLPWGTYEVCVDSQAGSSSRRKIFKEVHVENLAVWPALNFYLGSGTGLVESEGKRCGEP